MTLRSGPLVWTGGRGHSRNIEAAGKAASTDVHRARERQRGVVIVEAADWADVLPPASYAAIVYV